MPFYTYKAMDGSGRVVSGSFQAADEEALTALLKEEGLFLMESAALEEAHERAGAAAPGAPAGAPKRTGKAVPVKDLSLFTNQLNIMLKSALPALQAIETLAQQQQNKNFRAILEGVWDEIKKGESMSKAFEKHPEAFDIVYCSLMAAGEASGAVPTMLGRIGAYLEFKRELNHKLRTALAYPFVVVLTSMAVITFLLVFILPAFGDIFQQFNAPLPLPTRILLGLSDLLRSYWYVLIGAAVLVAWRAKVWLDVPANRLIAEKLVLDLPVIGSLARSVILTRVLRTLGTLVASGVPILRALELARASAGNMVYDNLLRNVIDRVTAGQGLASGLYETDYFPLQVTNMIANAERTGALPEVLEKICDYYEKETDNSIDEMFTTLEPLFVAFLGITVGGVAACILFPIITLSSTVQ